MIKSNFNSFKKDLEKEIKRQKEEQKQGFKAMVFFTYNNVVKLSPVDTGFFRSNNLISKTSPTSATLPEGVIESESQTISEGKASIELTNVKNGTSIFIQNNLPYADRLEAGFSKKAPVGIYGIAEEKTRRAISKFQNQVIKGKKI